MWHTTKKFFLLVQQLGLMFHWSMPKAYWCRYFNASLKTWTYGTLHKKCNTAIAERLATKRAPFLLCHLQCEKSAGPAISPNMCFATVPSKLSERGSRAAEPRRTSTIALHAKIHLVSVNKLRFRAFQLRPRMAYWVGGWIIIITSFVSCCPAISAQPVVDGRAPLLIKAITHYKLQPRCMYVLLHCGSVD